MPAITETSVRATPRRLWSWLWDQPTGVLLNVSAGGEFLSAKIRLIVTALLCVIPVINMATGDPWSENRVGVTICGVAILLAIALFVLVRRELARPWLAFATSGIDITIVSAALLFFALTGVPEVAVNSRIIFEVYFLAIAMTCLRYDLRVCILAGGLAMLEYAGVVAWSALHFDLFAGRFANSSYGSFSWSVQIAREILLFIAALLAIATVRRARRLHELSTNDYLTGLHNRGYFDERIREEVVRARRHRRVLSVAMIDVDRFKQFNDSFGHSAGDIALQRVAQAIREALRQTDVVARYGGEEIVLILPETPPEAAVRKLEAIRAYVEAMTIDLPRKSLHRAVTLSAGIASAPEDGLDVDQLLGRADTRLFAAKQMGRNRVVGPDQHSGLRPSSAEFHAIVDTDLLP
ncbi:MAG: GGDEF domain-containing protein [Gemmatimonadales bacterium]